MDSQRNRLRTRHKGACTNCRQMKLKCDGLERLPAPCSRCTASGKGCVIDRNFQRTARRDRLDDLEKELRELRAQLQKPASTNDDLISAGITESVSSVDHQVLSRQEDPGETIDLLDSDMLISQYQALIRPHRLEETELQPEEIIKHVILFYRHYHDVFPILPSFHYLLPKLQSSPLLLWAIVAITSIRAQFQDHLRVRLIEPIKRLAGTSIMGGEPPSVFLVQALLLLCIWPLPFKATINDPSWTYSGAAINIALRIGLHQPAFHCDFIYGSSSTEDIVALRTRSWAACFIVQQQLSLALGLPGMAMVGQTILYNMKSRSSVLSDYLRRMLFLSYKIHSFSNLLGQCEFSQDGFSPNPLPLVQAFEKDLDLLQTRVRTKAEETTVLAAKLHLYSYLLGPSLSERSLTETSNFIEGHHTTYYIGKSYSCASEIVTTMCDMFTEDCGIDTIEGIQRKCQWSLFQKHNLSYALLTLLWIVRLSETSHDIDAADALLRRGRNMLKECVAMNDDSYSRICDIVDYISSKKFGTPNDGTNGLKQLFVRSRMSANIIWNVVYAAKSRFLEISAKAQENHEPYSTDMSRLAMDPLVMNNFDVNTFIDGLGNFDLTGADWDMFLPTSNTNAS